MDLDCGSSFHADTAAEHAGESPTLMEFILNIVHSSFQSRALLMLIPLRYYKLVQHF